MLIPRANVHLNCILKLIVDYFPLFDLSEEQVGSDFYQQTEESDQFRQEYEMRKMKQACKFHSNTFNIYTAIQSGLCYLCALLFFFFW